MDEPKLNIGVTRCGAKPRMLRSVWSVDAVDDLRALYDDKPPIAPIHELAEALDDPNYNPDDPRSVEVWRRKKTKGLFSAMAYEMRVEIDKSIIDSLSVPPELME